MHVSFRQAKSLSARLCWLRLRPPSVNNTSLAQPAPPEVPEHQGCQGCWKAGGPERDPSVNMLFLSALLSNSASALWQQLNPPAQVHPGLRHSTGSEPPSSGPPTNSASCRHCRSSQTPSSTEPSFQAPDPNTGSFECTPARAQGPSGPGLQTNRL